MKQEFSQGVAVLYFDIGAYVGDKTAEYLSLGADKVIAVEPNPESYTSLCNRFKGNPKVIPINRAVSDTIGQAELVVPSANLITVCTLDPDKWFTGRFQGLTEAKRYKVKTTTLNALIYLYGVPDYLKVDCEGSEERILKGLSKPVPIISFEYDRYHLDLLIGCLRRLHHLGYRHCKWSRGEGWHSELVTLREALHQIRQNEDWGMITVIEERE